MEMAGTFAWRRWWLPEGEQPPLDSNDMLEDPEARYGNWRNPSARGLEQLSDIRLLTLLGDPGIGKSHELALEADRARALGGLVVRIDLGSYPTWQDLKEDLHDEPVIRHWHEEPNAELTLFLDAFDEATVAINNLVDGLVRELGRFDNSRFRLRIASRAVVWSRRLQQGLERLWPDSHAVYVLAPLTSKDVMIAGDATLASGGAAFVRDVRVRDVGALAARPVTLRLLLSVYLAGGGLPDTRFEVYRQGAEELASEHGGRRLEGGHGDPPRDARVRAAQLLAAVSLLSGSPQIEHRVPDGGTPPGRVSLDQVVTDATSLSDLDAVWGSALVVRAGDRRGTWVHRSIAEFLAASKLSGLPWPTVRHLLADPNGGDGVTPQLAGVAQWLSLTNARVLAWLATGEPELLLTADLAARTVCDRQTIAQSLIDALLRGEAPNGLRSYRDLGYEGLVEDLRPLLDVAQPTWLRREAMKMAGDNRLRDFDTSLVELIEEVAASKSPTDYDELVALAEFATYPLTWCDDPGLIERLWAVAQNTTAPTALRVEVLELAWARVSTSEAIARVDLSEPAMRSRRFAQAIADRVGAATTGGEADPEIIIAWLADNPTVVIDSDEIRELAALTVRACIARGSDLAEETWPPVGLVCAALIRETNDGIGLRGEDDPFPDPSIRRRLTGETLVVPDEPPDAWELRLAGLLLDEDFEYWLREYGRLIGSEDERAAVAEAATLALALPDYETREVARRVASEMPALSEFVAERFTDDSIGRYQDRLRAQEEREAQQSRRRDSELFSLERALAALSAEAWPQLEWELTRPTADDRSENHSYVHGTPVSQRRPWTSLNASQASEVIAIAHKYLLEPPADIAHGHGEAAAEAYALLGDVAPGTRATVPSVTLKLWLPTVAELPGRSEVASAMLKQIGSEDAEWVDSYLVARLASEASGEHVFIVDRMGNYTSERVEKALLRHVSDGQVRPHSVASLLAAAVDRAPDDAAEVAMAVICERPRSRPIADAQATGAELEEYEQAQTRWSRSVAAAAVLVSSDIVSSFFDRLLPALQDDSNFAEDVIRFTEVVRGRNKAFGSLTPDQTATLYLWARLNLPQDRWAAPGVAVSVDPVREFSGMLLRRLGAHPTEEHARALDTIASELERLGIDDSAVWVGVAARDAWKSVREASWAPAPPADIRDVLEVPSRRFITSQRQLAGVLVEAIDEAAQEISRDAGLRAIFWHRQKGQARLYVPTEENEFSDRFSRLLAERLDRIVIRREVQLQPRLGAQKGETPDIEATALLDDGEQVSCLIEVKGSWHDEVETALTSQLSGRYLRGPRGKTGIYLVAWFAGSAWDRADRRLSDSRRHTLDGLENSLRQAAGVLGDRGFDVRCRVVDLSLEQADVPASED